MPDDERKSLRQMIAAAIDQLTNDRQQQQENTVATPAAPANPKRRAIAAKQDELQRQALRQLAIIGGQLTQDDDVTYEGRKFVFPEQYQSDMPGLQTFVNRYVEAQTEMIYVDKQFFYHPHDGAHAVYHCLKDYFGYAQSKARQGLFGPQPPQEITIATGYIDGKLQHVTVPYGSDMVLPGLKGAVLTITAQQTPEYGPVLYLRAKVRRVDKAHIDGFYIAVEKYLWEHSIYRGSAIDGGMSYMDTEIIDPKQFVYTETAMAQLETHILSPIAHADILAAHGLATKRVVLMEGPYGSGKSGMGRIAAKVAVQHGVTAIIARPGVDDPFDVMKRARMYQPSFVFIEDVDAFSANLDPNYVTKLLDQFDGFGTKDLRMLLVLTTNHADRIHKGMLRPGRLDAVIHIGAMDRAGVEELCKIVIGDNLDEATDFDEVYEATEGFMPAYVREAIERAVRYTIARLGHVGKISTTDLVNACESLRAQFDLQAAALDSHEPLPPLDQMFRKMITEHATPDEEVIREVVDNRIETRINGAVLIDSKGNRTHQIATN